MEKDIIPQIPIKGEFANWAGVNNSELQAIIDFGFIQPSPEGKSKSALIIQRIILPPQVALQLGNILIDSFKKDGKGKTKKN